VVLQQCHKLVGGSGNNPVFPKRTWGQRAPLLNPEILQPLGERRKDRLSTAGECSGVYAVILYTFHMQLEVCVLIREFHFHARRS